MQENTEFLRASDEISSSEGNAVQRGWFVAQPRLFEVPRRGDATERLEGEDAALYALLLQAAFESRMTCFVQHDRGLTGDDSRSFRSDHFDRRCRAPGVQRWWRNDRDRCPHACRVHIGAKVPGAGQRG